MEQKKRITILDKRVLVRRIIKVVLNNTGKYVVDIAYSEELEEGLHLASRKKPALILIGAWHQGASETRVTALIQKIFLFNKVKVLNITDLVDENKIRCAMGGMEKLISERLIRVIDALLDEGKTERQKISDQAHRLDHSPKGQHLHQGKEVAWASMRSRFRG